MASPYERSRYETSTPKFDFINKPWENNKNLSPNDEVDIDIMEKSIEHSLSWSQSKDEVLFATRFIDSPVAKDKLQQVKFTNINHM